MTRWNCSTGGGSLPTSVKNSFTCARGLQCLCTAKRWAALRKLLMRGSGLLLCVARALVARVLATPRITEPRRPHGLQGPTTS